MLTKLSTLRYFGDKTHPITIEVDLRKGFPGFTIVGLPDTAVQEAKERIKSAITNSGLVFPYTYKIVVNLAPAALRKHGTSLDLPIALAILIACSKKSTSKNVEEYAVFGELSLDGSTVKTHGIAPVLLDAHHYTKTVVIPTANSVQARLCKANVVLVNTLQEAFLHITKQHTLPFGRKNDLSLQPEYPIDFVDVIGHEHAKRALTIAAVGGHHVRFTGPPGTGKTLLSSAFPSILPMLSPEEQQVVTRIHAIFNPDISDLIVTRPFRAPHHSCTITAMTGGGNTPTPGEITLAHNGVLFLDEAPEFSRQVLEALRQPLESSTIHIARSNWNAVFPARFTLLLAQNPCPCGFAFDPENSCSCSARQIHQYQQKLSGPLLDRIDLHVPLRRSTAKPSSTSITSAEIQQTVCTAKARLSTIEPLHIKQTKFLDSAAEKLSLSLRAKQRVANVAKTICAISTQTTITTDHILEALQFRQ